MTQQFDADAILIGGGLNGMVLALALKMAGLQVIILDAGQQETQLQESFDGRASAITAGSCHMLRLLGVWQNLETMAQPMQDILVTDGRLGERASPLLLHFDHQEIGDTPFGHMVENRHLRHALMRAVAQTPEITHRFSIKAGWQRSESGAACVETQDVQGNKERLYARLVIGCDGRQSRTAKAAGIRYHGWNYPQHGIVATVTHEQPHHGIAHEYFLPSGPFAILPLTENRSSLVWTERPDLADAVFALDDALFEAEIRRRFGDFLGSLSVSGPRWRYPLSMWLAERYVDDRLALVGDAAHGIHPIAGQGLNLGIQDSATLAEILAETQRLGLDIGGADVLARYQRQRQTHNTMMALGMDAMNRLFSNDSFVLRTMRDTGLAMVNHLPVLRRAFMRQAAGVSGQRPKMLRGEWG